MAYNHGREDRKWRIWKEAEEKYVNLLTLGSCLLINLGTGINAAVVLGGMISKSEFSRDCKQVQCACRGSGCISTVSHKKAVDSVNFRNFR